MFMRPAAWGVQYTSSCVPCPAGRRWPCPGPLVRSGRPDHPGPGVPRSGRAHRADWAALGQCDPHDRRAARGRKPDRRRGLDLGSPGDREARRTGHDALRRPRRGERLRAPCSSYHRCSNGSLSPPRSPPRCEPAQRPRARRTWGMCRAWANGWSVSCLPTRSEPRPRAPCSRSSSSPSPLRLR